MKYQHRVLGLLAMLSVITYLDRVCIAVAGPRMQESLGISPQAWGWVSGAFFLSYGVFEIPTGALGDRIGPRRVLTRIVLWWSAFTSLTGVVTGYWWLVFVRFCFGMGEAGAYPNASTVIARWIPRDRRARAWGLVWMTSQLGAAISPLIVVPIQVRYGWRASFWLFGILGVVWAAVWFAWFRDSPAEKAGVTPAELREIGVDGSGAHGGLPWSLAFRNATFWRVAIIGTCYVYVIAFFQSWLQTYLVRGHGYSESALVLSSLPYVVGACANGLGGLASDWLVRRYGLRTGRRALGAFGLSLAALFLTATIATTSGTLALVFLSIAYGGILAQQPNLCAVCLDIGRRHAGAVFGFMNTACQAAALVSSVLFGYLATYFGSYNAPFVPMVILLGFGTWQWLKVDPEDEIRESPGVELVSQAAM